MPFDRFLIAPLNSGLTTNLKPFLIPDDAWATLNNAYIFRGRLTKRFGSYLMGNGGTGVAGQLFSRLRINLGNTDGSGNKTGTVPGDEFNIGQLFSVGNEIFTVYQNGTPGIMYDTGAATVKTYNTTSGAYVINGAAPNTALYFYPAQPVMGLTVYEKGPINDQPSYGFDTQFAYVFAGGFWQRSSTGAFPVWHGTNDQFFWSTSWDGLLPSDTVLYTSNFNVHVGAGQLTDDPIWAYDGTTWQPVSYSPDVVINNPTNVQPLTVTQTTIGNNQIIANYIQTARCMLAFKGRLLLFNTIENNAHDATAFDPMNPTTTGITPTTYLTSTNTAYPNRVRFSREGSAITPNSWLEIGQQYNPGATGLLQYAGGGFADAPTEEAIVSVEFIKDRIIAYFERSTWELVFTQSQVEPFVWQKINTELGSESTFSVVPFDKVVLTVGNTGIHACNGTNVQRVDDDIPDTVFNIADKEEGVARVAGIRDYFTEMVYWTFPSDDESALNTFPNRVLVYNYKNNSWAINDDCITTWGYFEQQTGVTWASSQLQWQQNNATWNSGSQEAQFRQVIAGNQEGWTFIIDRDTSRNAPVMQLTNITATDSIDATLVVVDHTLEPGEWFAIENAQGITGVNGNIYQVNLLTDKDTFTVHNITFTGTYTGGGQITRVSNINMTSKQWNPYMDKGRDVYLARIDFAVLKTSDGAITVDYYPSSTQLSMIEAGQNTYMNMGNSILETFPYPLVPLEAQQARLWHPIYFQSDGECIQLSIYFSDAQISNPSIAWSPFEIEAMVLHTQATSQRLQ